MAVIAQEKTPAEIIEIQYDFSRALLPGETLILGNLTVSVLNALTDADATATILVTGSLTLVAAELRCRVQAGALGDIYTVVFTTGLTSYQRVLQGTIRVILTNSPSGDNAFCTVNEVKRRLKIPVTDTSDDELIEELILFNTRYVVGRLGRKLALTTVTETVYLDEEASVIRLKEYPIQKVDSIQFYDLSGLMYDSVTDFSCVDWTSYGSLVIRDVYLFPERPYYTRVVYRAGYTAIPEDIRDATIDLVCIVYRGIGREGLGGERIGEYAWSAPGAALFPPALQGEIANAKIEGVLRRYRRSDMMMDRAL